MVTNIKKQTFGTKFQATTKLTQVQLISLSARFFAGVARPMLAQGELPDHRVHGQWAK